MYPEDLLYSKEHEWLRRDGDLCVVGITQFAQEELGEVVYVELPEPGASFAAGDEIGTIESVKAVSEIFTPVAGEVVEVNAGAVDDPSIVNDDPHGDGWLVKIRVAGDENFAGLMSSEQYESFLASGTDG